ncbi:hypothetical protein BH09BAC1_BH09BAC1_23530 [soil metagenome]
MKIYVDTSVWGGAFDEEFEIWTEVLLDSIYEGKFTAVISDVTLRELSLAPIRVQELVANVPEEHLEIFYLTDEHEALATQYLKEGALSAKFESDALHIAIATIIKADILVSWNFKHMVNFFRIRQYNAVNLKSGYSIIDIRSPKEIVL